MNDDHLDTLLDEARATYRVPPPVDHDALWRGIEREAFPDRALRRLDWRFAAPLAAASLLIGVVLGRWTGPTAQAAAPAPATAAAGSPYQHTAEELLGQAAVLLASLTDGHAPVSLASQTSDQATQLLGTTRLLLDSPVAADPRLHALLLDLELTLAQVARMQPARRATDLTLINEAVADREIVPRIRSAVIDLNGGGGH